MGIKTSKSISFVSKGTGVVLNEITDSRRTPDSMVNGVILSPARARLLARAIRHHLVADADEMRKFLAGLAQEQRAEDRKDPQSAELRAVVWRKTSPTARPTATQTKTDADRRRELQAAELAQHRLEASVWRPAGAGKARIRTWNLDPARAAALMNAIAG